MVQDFLQALEEKTPILGYNKMHRGIDFAAKRGTPIYAAGDGIIERANFYGAYGRYIRIRHNSQYKTAYAHLSKFARGIKRNIKVKQGQVIGYVGTSGGQLDLICIMRLFLIKNK